MSRRRFLKIIGGTTLTAAARMAEGTSRYEPQEVTDLMTTRLYDEQFRPKDGTAEYVSKQLNNMGFEDAVNTGVIKRGMDAAVPLGLREGNIDFGRGMYNMWAQKPGAKYNPDMMRRRNHFVNEVSSDSAKSSIIEFRGEEISEGMWAMRELHSQRDSSYHGTQREFMRMAVDMLSADVVLSYGVHEIAPSTVNGVPINPAFKTWFIDRLLCEAGKRFVEGYPSRYDSYMSYGPFQLTNVATKDAATMNRYVRMDRRVPSSIVSFDGLQDHVNAAVFYAHLKWEKMGEMLKGEKLLKKFLKTAEGLSERERHVLFAGLTAAMHHQPAMTMQSVRDYLNDGSEKMHYGIKKYMKPKLRSYYDNSAENFLFMGMLHRLV